MKARALTLGLIAMVAVIFSVPTQSQAAVSEGSLTQGEFALWLVKAVGAQSKLPPAPTADDAIDFLTRLNIVPYPEKEWDKDGKVDREFLKKLLGDDATGKLSFEELLDRVRNRVANIFNDAKLGIFRAFGNSSSGSVTI